MFRPEAIINENNFHDNIIYIKKFVGDNVKIMPVVKANAYGHGVIEICKLLIKNGINSCCVALIEEAVNIRKKISDIEILHLGSIQNDFDPILLDKKLILTINSTDDIKFLDKIGKKYNHTFNIHIKVDTGMTRLGILNDDKEVIKDNLISSNYIKVRGIYTQLSSADEDNQSTTDLQRKKFIKIVDYFCSFFETLKFKHLTPSAGVLKNKKNHFNMVRPGLSLYGVSNVKEKVEVVCGKTLKSNIHNLQKEHYKLVDSQHNLQNSGNAKAFAELTKNKITENSGRSTMAQAHQNPDAVLTLLK